MHPEFQVNRFLKIIFFSSQLFLYSISKFTHSQRHRKLLISNYKYILQRQIIPHTRTPFELGYVNILRC